jgi:hypothetical protein
MKFFGEGVYGRSRMIHTFIKLNLNQGLLGKRANYSLSIRDLIHLEPKLSDLILHAVVAAGFPAERGFSLRCSSLDRAKLSFVGLRKLRNPSIRSGQALKVAATKSLNLGRNSIFLTFFFVFPSSSFQNLLLFLRQISQ